MDYDKIVIDDTEYQTLIPKTYKRKKYEPENPKLVKAAIPGLIKNLLVKENSIVKEGEILLILEAMKMENSVKAPVAGKIKKISVKTGQKVMKNQLMIELA